MVTVTSIRELDERFGAGLVPDRFGILAGEPAVVIDLDEGVHNGYSVPLIRNSPIVLIGVSKSSQFLAKSSTSELDPFDVLLTDLASPPSPWVHCDDLDEVMAALYSSISSSDQAAVSLVQLLRLSSDRSIDDALVAESMVYSMLQSGQSHQTWSTGRASHSRHETSDHVLDLARIDDRLHIRINRPQVHNALNTRLRDELIGAFVLASADLSIREVSLSGAGPSFCSGGDLSEFGTSDNPVDAHFIRITASVARAVSKCADRTSVLVHGACVGAGIEIAAFGRRVVATHDTSFRLPEVSMGLIPGAGGTVSLTRRIGRQRMAFMALSGQPIYADVALAWGLVDELLDPDHIARKDAHFDDKDN